MPKIYKVLTSIFVLFFLFQTKAFAQLSNTPPAFESGDWNMIFEDNFSGSSVDLGVWEPSWFSGNNTSVAVNDSELSCYDPDNLTVSGGTLKINAEANTDPNCLLRPAAGGTQAPYKSGLINSRNTFNFAYGYIEARIYTPGTGNEINNWPAFWTNGYSWPTQGEIDIFEGLSGNPCTYYHYNNGGHQSTGQCHSVADAPGWHIYSMKWTPTSIEYYRDGTLLFTVSQFITNYEHYIVANYGIRNTYTKTVPATMEVDYIRVWQTPVTVTIEQASGQSDPTNSSPISFDVEFSESVTGFTAADVYVTTTAGPVSVNVSGSGANYTVEVSGMSEYGYVTADILEGTVSTTDGNTNAASTSTDNTVLYNGGSANQDPDAQIDAETLPDYINTLTPTITGTAIDTDGIVIDVQYQINSTSGTWLAATPTDGNFNSNDEDFYFNPAGLSEGSNFVYARAQDDDLTYGRNPPYEVELIIDLEDPTAPGTPSTTTPTSDNTPTWTWATSSDNYTLDDTDPYQVQWCQQSDFSGCSSNTAYSATNSYTHGTSLSTGTWYFSVRAQDEAGNFSSYSSNGSVTIVAGDISLLLIDTPDSYTNAATPTITGQAITTTASIQTVEYQVDSTSGSWTTCTAQDGTYDEQTEEFSCTTSTLLEGEHTIYVRAQNNENTYSTNSQATFTVDTTAPTKPGLPTSDSTNNFPTWNWTESTDENGLASPAYQIQWSTDINFVEDVSSDTANSNTYTHLVELSSIQNTYLRIYAIDVAGNFSEYSDLMEWVPYGDDEIENNEQNKESNEKSNEKKYKRRKVVNGDMQMNKINNVPLYTSINADSVAWIDFYSLDLKPTFAGTGPEGMKIRVSYWPNETLCETFVEDDGKWACQSEDELAVKRHRIDIQYGSRLVQPFNLYVGTTIPYLQGSNTLEVNTSSLDSILNSNKNNEEALGNELNEKISPVNGARENEILTANYREISYSPRKLWIFIILPALTTSIVFTVLKVHLAQSKKIINNLY